MKTENDSDTLDAASIHELATPGVVVRNAAVRLPRRRRRARVSPVANGTRSSALGADGRCFLQATVDDLNRVIDAVERARSAMSRRCEMHGHAGYWRRR